MAIEEIKIDILHGIDNSLYERLIKNTKKYKKGQTIYQKANPCKSMDIVIDGSLVAYLSSDNGSESRVFTFQKNNVIGANLLFSNRSIYPLNIYATTDVVLLHIEKSDVELLLKNYEFTMKFIKNISFNSQVMNQKIAMSTQKTLRINLLEYLEKLSREQKSKTIKLTISKKQLADYLGVQRPSLFREFKNLVDEKILTVDNRKITLLRTIN